MSNTTITGPLSPTAAPRRLKMMWLLTLAMAIVVLIAQEADVVLPIPFMMVMLITVAVSGAAGGFVSGLVSGLLMSGMIVYFYLSELGPAPLTGTTARAAIGGLVAVGVGAYFGALRDRIVSLFEEVQSKRRELAAINDELADRVEQRTRELRLSEARLRRVTRHWFEAEETERRSLARDLHDDVGQSLTALRMSLEGSKPSVVDHPELAQLCNTATDLVRTSIDSVRQLSLNLRPSLIDDLGLSAAVREYATRQLDVAGIKVRIRKTGDDTGIDSNTSITAYRLMQEAVSNVLKHSDATRVDIELAVADQQLELTIADNGKGFDPDLPRRESDSFGLVSMRERADMMDGKLEVSSSPGEGTTVRFTLPTTQQRDPA